MDSDLVLGYVAAAGWAGLMLYLPYRSLRETGLRGWLDALRRAPGVSLASAILWVACVGVLLWALTGTRH